MVSDVIAIIPARYESTRLPGKPLADIAGKPMIQHVYERAAAVRSIARVIVATDDARIQKTVQGFGGEAFMTGTQHVSGTDRIAEVARTLDAEILVNVQGDLPFLEAGMVDDAIGELRADDSLPMSTVKTVIRDAEAMNNPNVVKVVTNRDGDALYFSRSPLPYWRGVTDDGVMGYKHLGLYGYRRDFLLRFTELQPTPLELAEKLEQLRALEFGYRIRVVETVAGLGVEVDTPEDLERARRVAAS